MAIITGTEWSDTLVGTANDDVIEGLGGPDHIRGGGGNDVLRGGAGQDNLDGGSGDDHVEGGDDADNITDHDGGNDWLDGGAGHDYISVQRNYRPTIEHVRIDGGSGNDQILYSNQVQDSGSTVQIDAGDGDDVINLGGFGHGAKLTLGLGQDTLFLSTFNRSASVVITDFTVGAAGDRIELLQMLGETLVGWNQSLNPFQTGHLSLRQDNADTVLMLYREGPSGSLPVDILTFKNVEKSTLTLDNLDGYAFDGSMPAGLVLTGTAGADTLTGKGGHDLLQGGMGSDMLRGGGGDDTLEGGEGGDDLDGGTGSDTLLGGEGNDLLRDTGGGNDTLDGGAGDDSLYLYRLNRSLTETVTLRGGDGKDSLTDWSYAAGTVTLDGGAGDDQLFLFTSSHSHLITLGTGRDTINLNSFQPTELATTTRTVTDFEVGPAGDTVLLGDLLTNYASWNPATNPFSAGTLRLFQQGNDTILQVRGFYGTSTWADLLVFKDRSAGSFTGENFGGLAPDGSPPPGVTLTGTALADTLTGGYGNDTIDGLEGADTISGGAGNDILRGGDGGDTISGGTGDDVIEGGNGNDNLWLYHEGGSDTIRGDAGDDLIAVYRNYEGVVENVTISAGADNDRVYYQNFNAGSVTIDLGSGADTLELRGNRGATTVTLGAGADWIDFGNYYASMVGETAITLTDFTLGEDRISWGSYFSRELFNWDQQSNPFATGHLSLSQNGANTSLYIDRDGAGTFYGPTLFLTFANVGIGALTRAHFDGLSPDGSDLDRRLNGSRDGDTLTGGGGNDTLLGGGGADYLDGRGGSDTADYGASGGSVIVDLAAGGGLWNDAEGDVLVSIENLTGSDWADWLYGDAQANRLTGGAGNDTLVARGGDDIVDGGNGNDVLIGGAGKDQLDGGAGTDTADYGGTYGAVIVDLAAGGGLWNDAEGDTLTGIENVIGTAWNDWLYGDAQNNVLKGNAGADLLDGRGGNDTTDYSGNFGAVWVSLAAGRGFWNYAEGDRYNAIENVTGTDFNDLIEGNAGANRLEGGAGADFLTGLGGNDTFVFAAALGGGNIDTISDMTAGSDKIALDNAIFAGFAEGALYSGAFRAGATALDADDNILYNAATGALYFDPDGNGAAAAIHFATLQPGLALSASDFFII